MFSRRSWLPGLAALAVAIAPRAGQAQAVELGLGGGWVSPGGDDYEDLEAGFGFDVVGRLDLLAIELGAGLLWNSHGIPGSDEDLTQLAMFAEPRYQIPVPLSPAQPFLGARLGWMRESALDATANGWMAGGLAGVSYGVTPVIALELTGFYNYFSLGDRSMDGTSAPNTDATGNNVGLRAGVLLQLGR